MFTNFLRPRSSASVLQLAKKHLQREFSQQCNHGAGFLMVAHFQSQPEIFHNHGRFFGTSHNFEALKKSTYVSIEEPKPGIFSRALESVGIKGSMKYNRFKIRNASLNLYTSCSDGVDIHEFFDACNLPDTFYSWWLVTELHVWMSLVRLRQEGSEGEYMKYYVVMSMWHDVQTRGKLMAIPSVKMKEALKKMAEQFNGALFAYDEGILSSDRVLAAALWRNLFGRRAEDPERLALIVEYVRKQVQYLDTLNSKQLLQRGKIEWLPMDSMVKGRHRTPQIQRPMSLDEELGMHDMEADKVAM